MATIFESIDIGMQDNGLAAALLAEVDKLSGAASLLAGLVQNPPSSIGDLIQGVASVSVPGVDVSGLASGVASLRGAVPSDLSGLTGGISVAIGGLKLDTSGNLTVKLTRFVNAIEAVNRLAHGGDLFASASSGGAAPAAPAAPAAGAPAGPPAGPPPAAPAAPGAAPATPEQAATAARQRRLEAVNQINGVLDRHAPFDAPGMVVFLRDQLAALPRDNVKLRRVPYYDDMVYLLVGSTALREMDAAALKQHVRDTLDNLADFLDSAADWPLADFVVQLQTLAAAVDAAALRTETEAVASRLRPIAAAVASGNAAAAGADVAATNAALDTLLPRLAALNASLFDGQADAATRAFQQLPLDLDRQMRRVAQAVKPASGMQTLGELGDRLRDALGLPEAAGIADDLEALLNRVLDTLRGFDLGPIKDALLAATQALTTAADEIDRLLSGVAAQAALLFDELDRRLADIDIAPFMAEITDAIENFGNELEAKVAALFAPVKTAIAQAVGEIGDALGAFDPTQIVDALEDAIGKLTAALDAPEVKGAIDSIRQTIEAAAEQLKVLSFTPVTGAVIAEIDAVTAILNKIDPATLSPAIKLALTGAVAILPGDLEPVTDPLNAEFGTLVDAGPKPVLELVASQPARLLAEVKKYSPDKLIGDELGKPLAALIAELEKFKPSALLAPVEQALAGLKDELKQKANPGQLLGPLETVFNELLAEFDKLNPAALVQPLDAALTQAIDEVITALPADELVQGLDQVLAAVKGVTDLAAGVRTTLQKAQALVAGLADAEQQLRAWYQPVLDRVDQFGEVASLQPAFDKVSAAVDRLRAAALAAAVDAVLGPLKSGLDALDAQALLGDLGQAYRGIRADQLAALPASAEKAAIVALLARFNPVAAEFARPYEGLQRWRADLARDRAALQDLLQYWDTRFHEPNGLLAGYKRPAATLQDVRTLLGDALENDVIKPLGRLVGIFHTYGEALAVPLSKITAFVAAFEARVNELMTGPGSLGGVRDAFAALIARLRAIDLQFLVRELDATFALVKGKLQAVSPTVVRTAVEATFNQALDSLDLSQLVPQSEVEALDATYAKIIDDLKKLDPKKLVVDAVQPVFDNTVVPLLQAFDISVVIRALIERLDALKVELGTELARTNTSYQAMLAAVPTFSLTDISLDIDIGVDIGF